MAIQAQHRWASTSEFRQLLPEFSECAHAEIGSDCAEFISQYAQFYNLQFNLNYKHFMGRFRAGEYELVGQIFSPPVSAGTLFVFHGYFDHLGLFRFPIETGLNAGYTVVGFDLPGHGLSSGPGARIDCFSRYALAQKYFIEALTDELCPKPWCALGQSTGAAVILDSGVSYYSGLILLAPLIRVYNWYWTRLLYQALRHRGGVERTFKNNSNNPEFLTFLRDHDPLQHRRIESEWVGAMIQYTKRILKQNQATSNVLVFQGDDDRTVDYLFNMKKLNDLFIAPDIQILKGARHHLVNESEIYLQEIKAKSLAFLEGLKS